MPKSSVPSGATSGHFFVVLLAAGVTSLGWAADAPPPPPATAAVATAEENRNEELQTVVVTGSHIRKDEYTSASPIQIIKRDESVLAGLVTSTEILQGSTVSGGGNQINNYFGGYVTDGGPGANTISLRGLGAVRTLVLLNGRRLAPAGTRGSVGSADLNVLPNAMVDRIEILKDGASSVYGSDAVAGVVNIITRKGINDFTVEGQRVQTFDGGGAQTRISFVGGHTWDKFELSGSVELYDRGNLAVGERDWATCPTVEFIDPQSGDYVPGTLIDPSTGKPRCFPVSNYTGAGGIAHNYIVSPQGGVLDPEVGFQHLGNRWMPDSTSTGPLPGWRNVDDYALRPGFDPRMLNDSLISPTRNLTAFVNGSYDIGALGNAEAYFEALLTRRDSKQIGTRQLSLDYQTDAEFNNHPFVPVDIYNGWDALFAVNPFGDFVETRAFVIWGNDTSRQTVDFGRFVAGLRGDLPFAGDWRYDANVTVNRADAAYTFETFLTDRIYNSVYVAPVGPEGTSDPTRTVNGITYTCQVNIDSPGTGCVPAPVLDAAFLGGAIDQAYRDYVWKPVTGHTTYDEYTFSAIADGSLIKLPYGKMRGALGVEYRTMKFNDTPSQESINENLYNFTSAGITRGKDAEREIFAEVEAPLLRGLPFAEDLTLNVSGRYTDYNSYGSDETYKLGLDYTPVGWLKLRGTTGTSYRAPAIFEQYLAPTSGFLPGSVDPCEDYGLLPPSSALYQNCAADGLPPDWFAASSVRVNAAGGSANGLKSETSKAETIGVVLQPTLNARIGGLALAVDWWRIAIDNEVVQIGASNILRLCYNDPNFRAGGRYCSYVTRDVNGNAIVQDDYHNVSSQVAEGVDYNLRYTRDIGVGALTVDLRATRYLRQDSRLVPTDPIDHYNGTLLAPKWVGDTDFRYKWKDWTFYYGFEYIDAMDSNAYYGVDPKVDPYDLAVGSYVTHNASIMYESKNKWSAVLSVRNFTDKVPDTILVGANYDRVGNTLLYSGYDYYGARASLTVTKTF